MTIEQLLEKFEEIKLIVEDMNSDEAENEVSKIIAICEDAQLDYKIEQRLNERRTDN